MDRAQAPFSAEGLNVPSYVAFGNHDGLVQGNAAATRAYEDVGTGCVKPTAPAVQPVRPAERARPAATSRGLFGSDPGKVGLVPRDPRPPLRRPPPVQGRCSRPGQADGHGFGYVDGARTRPRTAMRATTRGRRGKGFRFIALDTVSEGGVPGPSAEGNIDDPQFRWLERQLRPRRRRTSSTIVFGHHPIRSLNSPIADEQAGPCTGDDAHGHGTNPGCDRDPRNSTPVHLGRRPPGAAAQAPARDRHGVRPHAREQGRRPSRARTAAASGGSRARRTSTGRCSRG